MKQGSGNNSRSGGKMEPRSAAVSVDKVANIGNRIVRTHPPTKSLYSGRGFEAPAPVAKSVHKAGSQGKR